MKKILIMFFQYRNVYYDIFTYTWSVSRGDTERLALNDKLRDQH